MKKQFIKDNEIITLGDSVVYYEQVPIYAEVPKNELDNPEYQPEIESYEAGTKMVMQNASEEFILSLGYEPYTAPTIEPILIYEEEVEKRIRERYNVSEELAILRQKETKPDEFSEYFRYCEDAKAEFNHLKLV